MPKIGFKRLAKGVALLTGHIHAQIATGLSRLTATGVQQDNLQRGDGTFRLNLSLPWVPGDNGSGSATEGVVAVPFMLPPLQEFWSSTGSASSTTPQTVLEEVCISFDQRAEAAAITMTDTGVLEGELDFSATDNLNLKVSILSKEMQVWTAATSVGLTRQEYALDLAGVEFFGGEKLRLNPMNQADLETVIDPYRTYMLEVSFPDLPAQTTPVLQVCSVLVSLRFRQKLVPRDGSTTQNIPTAHNGALNTSAVTISTPAAAATIEADANDGVNTVMEKIDEVFLSKLNAGYDEKSKRRDAERILDNAAYEVIAVPMFGNRTSVLGGNVFSADLPYIGSAPYTGETGDRRIIPLHFPMTIHHVIACVNYTRTVDAATRRPTTATLTNKIGVGIGSGLRSDGRSYRQVALASWAANTGASAYKIDQIGTDAGTGQQWDILTVPLTYIAGAASGKGYPSALTIDQGKPYFAGQTDSPLATRSNTSLTLNGSAAANFGQEQFLEVRWNIVDSVGMNNTGNFSNNETIVGHGGHWVFIIGKKHLA
jgi:hypothetical protein